MPVQPDPQTANLGYFVPLNGADVGTWDEPMNANYLAIDNTFSRVSSISLASGNNVVLSTPTDDSSSWMPTQSQSALLRFSGNLPNNVTVTLPRPGFWLVENLCTNVATYVVFLRATNAGAVICAPPGEMVHVFCDGIDCKYVAMGRVGELMDLAVSTVPAWITNCTMPPYLNCDGRTITAATYPALFSLLGGSGGGTVTLPDIRGKGRVSLNQGTGRYTATGGGVDGNTLFASGGAQTTTLTKANLPSYNLNVTDPGHIHGISCLGYGGAPSGQFGTSAEMGTVSQTYTGYTGLSVASGGGNQAFGNVPPIIVSGLTLIRAA